MKDIIIKVAKYARLPTYNEKIKYAIAISNAIFLFTKYANEKIDSETQIEKPCKPELAFTISDLEAKNKDEKSATITV